MRIRKRLLALGLLIIPATSGCKEPAREPLVRPVRAIKVGDVAGLNASSFPGRARATEEVNLAFRVSGELTELPIDVGTVIKKGDLLAKLDQRDFQAALDSATAGLNRAQAQLEAMLIARPEEIRRLEAEKREAEAALEYAVAEHGRNLKLIKTGAITQSVLDRSKAASERFAAVRDKAIESLRIAEEGAREEDIRAHEAEIKSLEAEVAKRRNDVEYTELMAPFDGTISVKYVDNYQTVNAGQIVCRLLDASQIEIVIDIPESRISLAPYVTDIVCVFDAFPDVEIQGVSLKEIGTEASATTRTYPVTLIMDQPDASTGIQILPGLGGRVRGTAKLPEGAGTEGFVIPETCLYEGDDGQKYVWLLDDNGQIVRRSKPLNSWESTSLGIRVQGLAAGQWVVTAGVHYLSDGQEVRILKEPGDSATESPAQTESETKVSATESAP